MCALIALTLLGVGEAAAKGPYEWAFIRLDYARQEKVRQFNRYCDQIHDAARQAGNDEALLSYFDVNRKYHDLKARGAEPPEELTLRLADFGRALDDHYIRNYLCFYDILMVDSTGEIFHTIRKESDYNSNLFEGALADTSLARCLRDDPREEIFIDFQHYPSSDKPAAFFIEPVVRDGRRMGWLILQCSINKVNSLFAGDESLGETGETFLINHEGYMLTESNFQSDSSILAKRLDDRNIRVKFQYGRGHRRVVDYRGMSALTSFELVELLGTQWLVVAKVDEAQIITEHFRLHQQYYMDKLMRRLAGHELVPSDFSAPLDGSKTLQVDMDEFVRATRGELLRTVGVSTCTAIIATYPGKFGYLAHVSPLDRMYGGDSTNLLGHVVKKIKTYDIHKYERSHVSFVVVAGHRNSLPRIVEKLVGEGFMLSQINVMSGPAGSYANVTYEYARDNVSVEWASAGDGAPPVVQNARDCENLGDMLKLLIAGETGDPGVQGLDGPAHASRGR